LKPINKIIFIQSVIAIKYLQWAGDIV